VDTIFLGETFDVIINYVKDSIPWNHKFSVKPIVSGPSVITAPNSTNQRVVVEVKKKQLGDKYTNYDKDLIDITASYGIPADLMKSVIYQESLHNEDEQLGQEVFQSRSYRYEAHKDFDWYARSQVEAKNTPITSDNKCNKEWRGLTSFPENKFTIGGHLLNDIPVEKGDQLPNNYKDWSRYTSGGPLKFTSLNPTAQELVNNNPKMGWTNRTPCWVGSGSPWNFTAQLVLAASYGLTQVLYETAINRGFDVRVDNGQSAVSIEKLFDPKVIIDLSAKHLKKQYTTYGNWPQALESYNNSALYATEVMKRWDNGEGNFKLIVK
jgi:hypothetical protein